MAYVTSSAMASRLQAPSSADVELAAKAEAASRRVDSLCHRTFEAPTGVTTRLLRGTGRLNLDVPDIASLADMVVEVMDLDDGTWAELAEWEPIQGGDAYDTRWPYVAVRRLDGEPWPPCGIYHHRVRIGARYGWAAVPAEVGEAAAMLAAMLYRLNDAPLGVVGFEDFGPMRVREMEQITNLISTFVRDPL